MVMLIQTLAVIDLNLIVLENVKAPEFLIINLVKVVDVLEINEKVTQLFKGIKLTLIEKTLKCLSFILRRANCIKDFLKNEDRLLLRIIQFINAHVSQQGVVLQGLVVIK